MGNNAAQSVATFRNLASSIERAQKPALMKAANAGRVAMLRAPGVPHQVAKHKVDVKVKAGDRSVTLAWSPPGLTRIVNDPTKAHMIQRRGFVGTRSVGARAVKGAKLLSAFGLNAQRSGGALKLPDGGFRGSVPHPGTKGKHFVEKGHDAARPIVTRTYGTAVLTEPMKQVFHG